jgi:hypothetical protein
MLVFICHKVHASKSAQFDSQRIHASISIDLSPFIGFWINVLRLFRLFGTSGCEISDRRRNHNFYYDFEFYVWQAS